MAPRHWAVVAAAVAALFLLCACRVDQVTGNGPSATAGIPGQAGPSSAGAAVDLLSAAVARSQLAGVLRVSSRPHVTGYQRGCGAGQRCVFGPAWTDNQSSPGGHNGCGTRDDVLAATLSQVRLRAGSRCVVVAGVLEDPYTNQMINFRKANADAVEIDHVVPLALAWDLGASRWPAELRVAFANDPLELLAVSGPANQAKGDDGPSAWVPPDVAYRCDYAARFVSVLVKYHLSVVAADAARLSIDLGRDATCH